MPGIDKHYISGSKESVKNQGEVMTPLLVVEDMLNQLPDEVWTNPLYVFLEPSCGTGNFLDAIFVKRIFYLRNTILDIFERIECILNTIIGMEINTDTLRFTRERLLKRAVTTMNLHNFRPSRYQSQKLRLILMNNIFDPDGDSITFISQGKLEQKKFVFHDPTGYNSVMSATERKVLLRRMKNEGSHRHYNG